VIDFFYHHDLAKILFTSMCSAASHIMSIFACDRCPVRVTASPNTDKDKSAVLETVERWPSSMPS